MAVGQKIKVKRSGVALAFFWWVPSWVGFKVVCVCECVSIERSFLRSLLYQTSETEHASFRGIADHAGRDSSHRRIETMRELQTEILRASTTCIAQTRALQFVNNAQSPPVECTHHAHARPAMCARETMRCFVAQDPLRRCVFGSSERAVRRFRISRSRHY